MSSDVNKETIAISLDKGLKDRLKGQNIFNISGFFNAFALSWLKRIEAGETKDVMAKVMKEVDVKVLIEKLYLEARK